MAENLPKTLNEALGLIQRAETFTASDAEETKKTKVNDLVVVLKEQLHEDHDLPLDFLNPVDFTDDEPDIEETIPEELAAETVNPVDPQLSDKAFNFCLEIEALMRVEEEKNVG